MQIDNPEKLVTLGTQDKQNKEHTTMRKNESNVNKTLAPYTQLKVKTNRTSFYVGVLSGYSGFLHQ
jgi:hypothetical protein